jgi:hypothetical protein
MNFTTELNRLIGLLDAGLITPAVYNEAVDAVFAKYAK